MAQPLMCALALIATALPASGQRTPPPPFPQSFTTPELAADLAWQPLPLAGNHATPTPEWPNVWTNQTPSVAPAGSRPSFLKRATFATLGAAAGSGIGFGLGSLVCKGLEYDPRYTGCPRNVRGIPPLLGGAVGSAIGVRYSAAGGEHPSGPRSVLAAILGVPVGLALSLPVALDETLDTRTRDLYWLGLFSLGEWIVTAAIAR